MRAVRTCICRDRALLAHDWEHCGSCALCKLARKLARKLWASTVWRRRLLRSIMQSSSSNRFSRQGDGGW